MMLLIKTILYLFLFILIAQMAGILGSIATVDAIPGWYATLAAPAFTPPNWVFAPVWTLLYTLMGIASFLVWRSGEEGRWKALGVYGAHLAVNAYWSVAFFGQQNLLLALLVIALLALLLCITIALFYRHSKVAGLLLLPYLAWVLFATYLTAGFFLLN